MLFCFKAILVICYQRFHNYEVYLYLMSKNEGTVVPHCHPGGLPFSPPSPPPPHQPAWALRNPAWRSVFTRFKCLEKRKNNLEKNRFVLHCKLTSVLYKRYITQYMLSFFLVSSDEFLFERALTERVSDACNYAIYQTPKSPAITECFTYLKFQ